MRNNCPPLGNRIDLTLGKFSECDRERSRVALNSFSDAFERGSFILTHNNKLGRAVFAAEALRIRRNGQQSAAACAFKNGRFVLKRCVHQFL